MLEYSGLKTAKLYNDTLGYVELALLIDTKVIINYYKMRELTRNPKCSY